LDEILALAGRAAGGARVARIFINLERRSPPATFRLFGPRVVPTFNYFQTAAVVGADGYLDAEDVARVGRVLFEGAGYTARALENSLADLVRRGVLEPAAADALGARLRATGVLPPGDEKGARWRRVLGALGRLRRRRGSDPLRLPLAGGGGGGGRAPAPREGARRRPARAGGPRARAAQLPGTRGPGPPRGRRIRCLPRMARPVDRPRRLKAPAARPPLEREFSAGGLVYRRRRGEVAVVLAARRHAQSGALVWTLPKGHLQPGESL